MKTRNPLPFALALFGLVTLACSLAGLFPGGSSNGASSGEVVYDENGQPVEIEAPPPDFLEVLSSRVAAGEIGEAEALIAALKLFVGEDPGLDPFDGQEVEAFEGTGLFHQAAYYLENGRDAQAKAEIERLLRTILPSPEALERFSQPASGSGGQQRPVRPAPAGDEAACRALWKAAFPADAASLVCLLYFDFTFNGTHHRIYYPESKRDDPGYVAYVQAAQEALQLSLTTYTEFSNYYDDIDLIFALVEPDDFGSSGPPRGSVPSYDVYLSGSNRCPILIYPAAFTETIEDFRQIVAHEVFHCFINWRQGFLHTTDSIWYLEAMPNYYSNLVYPANNLEFRFQPRFDVRTLDKSLFRLSYENTIFFQYLGNVWGNQRVFELLDALDPVGSHADHAAALASKGVTQELFQDFGRDYMDLKIDDSGGGVYPIKLYYRDVFLLNADKNTDLQAETFQLARYLLRYTDEDRAEYKVALTESGVAGRNTAQRWPELAGPWRPLPGEFTSRCGADGDRLLLTTVEGGGSYDVNLNVHIERRLECACVVGNWVQDTPEIEGHLRTVLPSSITLVSLSGQFLLVIDDAGNMTFTPQDYRIVVRTAGGPEMEVAIAGAVTSTYVLPEDQPNTIVVTPQTAGFDVAVTVDGSSVSVPLPAEAFTGGPFSDGGSWQYECSDTTLTAVIPPGAAPFGTSSYERLSDAPATPVPEATVDAPGGPPPDDAPLDTTDGGGGGLCTAVQAADFGATGNRIRWTLRNSGPTAVNLSAVTLRWPAANGAWTRIELGGVTLWTGSESSGTARIDGGWSGSAADRTLAAGASAELALTFAGAAAPSGYVLVVDTADGCILSDVR